MNPELIDRIQKENEQFASEVIGMVHKNILDKVEHNLREPPVINESLDSSSVDQVQTATTPVTIVKDETGRYSFSVEGKTWHSKRRRDLVRVARRHGFVVVDA